MKVELLSFGFKVDSNQHSGDYDFHIEGIDFGF